MRPVYYKVFDQSRYMGTYTATEFRQCSIADGRCHESTRQTAGDTEDAIPSCWLTIPRD